MSASGAVIAAIEECPALLVLAALGDQLWGTRRDPGNFHRKVTRSPGFLVPHDPQGPPAQLRCRGEATLLSVVGFTCTSAEPSKSPCA